MFVDYSDYNIIKNNSFVDNSARSLYLFYNFNSTVEDNNYSSENDFYETIDIAFIGNNNYTLYNYNPSDITVIPSKYDLRDFGYVTSIKIRALTVTVGLSLLWLH